MNTPTARPFQTIEALGEPDIGATELTLQPTAQQVVPQRQPLTAPGGYNPGDLLRVAMERGDVDLDRLERLAGMVRDWKAEEARLEFLRDFAAFTKLGIVIPKTKMVDQRKKDGSQGPSFMQSEFDIACKLLKPPLGELGFSVSFDNKFIRAEDGGVAWCRVQCTLDHRGGHSRTLELEGPPDSSGSKNALQEMQSSASFLMRHAFLAITATAQSGADNDGNGARGGGYRKPSRARSGDEAGNAGDAATDVDCSELLDAGRSKSHEGWRALQAWWAALTNEQRDALMPDFPAMKERAAKVDAEAKAAGK